MRLPGRKSSSSDNSDWVTQATKSITGFVDNLHDKAVVPLTTIVRAVVFGTFIVIAGLSVMVMTGVALLRLADVYLDNIPGVPEGVWFAYLVLGAIFVVASLFLWSKRSTKSA